VTDPQLATEGPEHQKGGGGEYMGGEKLTEERKPRKMKNHKTSFADHNQGASRERSPADERKKRESWPLTQTQTRRKREAENNKNQKGGVQDRPGKKKRGGGWDQHLRKEGKGTKSGWTVP